MRIAIAVMMVFGVGWGVGAGISWSLAFVDHSRDAGEFMEYERANQFAAESFPWDDPCTREWQQLSWELHHIHFIWTCASGGQK